MIKKYLILILFLINESQEKIIGGGELNNDEKKKKHLHSYSNPIDTDNSINNNEYKLPEESKNTSKDDNKKKDTNTSKNIITLFNSFSAKEKTFFIGTILSPLLLLCFKNKNLNNYKKLATEATNTVGLILNSSLSIVDKEQKINTFLTNSRIRAEDLIIAGKETIKNLKEEIPEKFKKILSEVQEKSQKVFNLPSKNTQDKKANEEKAITSTNKNKKSDKTLEKQYDKKEKPPRTLNKANKNKRSYKTLKEQYTDIMGIINNKNNSIDGIFKKGAVEEIKDILKSNPFSGQSPINNNNYYYDSLLSIDTFIANSEIINRKDIKNNIEYYEKSLIEKAYKEVEKTLMDNNITMEEKKTKIRQILNSYSFPFEEINPPKLDPIADQKIDSNEIIVLKTINKKIEEKDYEFNKKNSTLLLYRNDEELAKNIYEKSKNIFKNKNDFIEFFNKNPNILLSLDLSQLINPNHDGYYVQLLKKFYHEIVMNNETNDIIDDTALSKLESSLSNSMSKNFFDTNTKNNNDIIKEEDFLKKIKNKSLELQLELPIDKNDNKERIILKVINSLIKNKPEEYLSLEYSEEDFIKTIIQKTENSLNHDEIKNALEDFKIIKAKYEKFKEEFPQDKDSKIADIKKFFNGNNNIINLENIKNYQDGNNIYYNFLLGIKKIIDNDKENIDDESLTPIDKAKINISSSQGNFKEIDNIINEKKLNVEINTLFKDNNNTLGSIMNILEKYSVNQLPNNNDKDKLLNLRENLDLKKMQTLYVIINQTQQLANIQGPEENNKIAINKIYFDSNDLEKIKTATNFDELHNILIAMIMKYNEQGENALKKIDPQKENNKNLNKIDEKTEITETPQKKKLFKRVT